jgi:hypothetical protein
MRPNRTKREVLLPAITSLSAALVFSSTAYGQDNTWFVDDDGPAEGDGLSWDTAFRSVKHALNVASNSPEADNIRVAEGTYTPGLAGFPNQRVETFLIDFSHVTLEGGYAGLSQPDNPNERDVEQFQTTLTGDYGAPSGVRVYHVVTVQDVGSNVRIDGFRIIAGDADITAPNPRGGGMLIKDANPFLVQCTFFDNFGVEGGGLAIEESQLGEAEPQLINCRFFGNSADEGGGVFVLGGEPGFINCLFRGNTANSFGTGGGVLNAADPGPGIAGKLEFANCTFHGNKAYAGGGLMNESGCEATLTNCIFWDDSGGEIVDVDEDKVSVDFTCVEGGYPGLGNISADPLFLDPDGPNNRPFDEDDDLRLNFASPCNDVGKNAGVPADSADLDGDGDSEEQTPLDLTIVPRFTVDTGADVLSFCDPATVDMGAYENANCNRNFLRDEEELEGNDVNEDGIPDDCQDCNDNEVLDPYELEGNDCNANGKLDECEIVSGCVRDCDENGVPDVCESAIGTNLRQFDAPDPGFSSYGRGMAFDGEFLYYTLVPEDYVTVHDTIYQITTDGVEVGQITPFCSSGGPVGRNIGALAFAPFGGVPMLWAATYDNEDPVIFRLDVATGRVIQSMDVSALMNPDEPGPTYIDGLASDPTDNSLFYSSDLGFEVLNVRDSGGYGCAWPPAAQNAAKGYLFAEGDLSGHAFDGDFLFAAQPEDLYYSEDPPIGDPNTDPPPQIFRTLTDSATIALKFQPLSTDGGDDEIEPEDMAFDAVTFSGQCAVWVSESLNQTGNNRIVAFEVPCPCESTGQSTGFADLNGDAVVNVVDLSIVFGLWGVPFNGPPDFDGDSSVGAADLLILLANWGNCDGGNGPEPPSLKQLLEEVGLMWPDDWIDFGDCLMQGTPDEQGDSLCWMTHYLMDCQGPGCQFSQCLGDDPFGGH